jgi:hypothetical protein
MRIVAAIALLLPAACGEGDHAGNRGPSENQIARLSTPKVEEVDRQAPARMQPLEPADLAQAGLADPVCDFSRDGRMLFAVSAADAVARVGGTLLHFAHSGPLGPTGGFFEDRQVSISVGRVGEMPPGDNAAAGIAPARITVTNRRADAQTELEGVWRCDS